jgi:Xaa-Pro aminopeptidase
VNQEIESRYCGYATQSNHTVHLGAGGEAEYRTAMGVAVEALHEVIASVRPGVTIGDVMRAYRVAAESRGAGARGMAFHTSGLGHDRPTSGVATFPPAARRDDDWVIEPGWAFSFKTEVVLPSGVWALVGDGLVVDGTGAARLGTRPLEPVVLG